MISLILTHIWKANFSLITTTAFKNITVKSEHSLELWNFVWIDILHINLLRIFLFFYKLEMFCIKYTLDSHSRHLSSNLKRISINSEVYRISYNIWFDISNSFSITNYNSCLKQTLSFCTENLFCDVSVKFILYLCTYIYSNLYHVFISI